MYINDTIAAITTPPGIGGVAIIRVSGKDALTYVESLFKSKDKTPLRDRVDKTIHYGFIYDGDFKIDEVLLLLMKGPRSYTAEDVVEIQCHGGYISVQKILECLLKRGCRLAEPGEFTKRAFLNGRINLIQAEATMDIIQAKTEESLKLAVNQLGGVLHERIYSLREKLITLISHMEVVIDYPEEDIEDITLAEAQKSVSDIMRDMTALLEASRSGKLLRDGITVAIIGKPNAGKSSLLNALLCEKRAIVTEIPGTTRDIIKESMDIEGILIHIIDTAGIRKTDDVIEQLGVEKSQDYLATADLLLIVLDGTKELDSDDLSILTQAAGRPSIIFINKKDRDGVIMKTDVEKIGTFSAVKHISALQGEGMETLHAVVKSLVFKGEINRNHDCMLSNVRQIDLMRKSHEHLQEAMHTVEMGLPIDCVVTDVRQAWELLGELTGDSIREDMMDELFKRFCLGK